ncbi:hypothetical protein, partial [Commensalibacter sp. A3DC]|uniref:hypothetical protein n=1 Tax=Commensalibacter sp. A3DC TaxID=3093920 RepID=UPI0039B36C73
DISVLVDVPINDPISCIIDFRYGTFNYGVYGKVEWKNSGKTFGIIPICITKYQNYIFTNFKFSF